MLLEVFFSNIFQLQEEQDIGCCLLQQTATKISPTHHPSIKLDLWLSISG